MNITIHPSVVSGTVTVPPSKSYTHRAIILASLAKGTSILSNILLSDDTTATIEACRALGAEIELDKKNNLNITGFNGKPKPITSGIDCKSSGTTLRLMTGVAALSSEKVRFTGSKRLQERPIAELTNGLDTLMKQNGGEVKLTGRVSSQFVSALLLIAPLMTNPVTILLSDEARSKPYIDITIDIMEKFGVEVVRDGYKKFSVHPSTFSSTQLTIEGDYSNASYFFAAAAITGGKVTVTGLNPHSKQGDRYFLEILREMGSTIEMDRQGITVSGKANRGIDIDLGDYPDIVQTVAVVAATVPEKSIIKNIGHLRLKEADRIANTAEELGKFGIKTEITDHSLTILGGNPNGAVVDPHNDHRMAMSMAVLGLGANGETKIQNAEVVTKSYPGFWEDFKRVTIHNSSFMILHSTIILIGMRGSGKTTIGRMLAQRLGMEFIEMDEELEKNVGMSISDFVKKYGWDAFRDEESKIVKELKHKKNCVISTGGGVILREENVKILKSIGTIIWLKVDLDTLIRRIGEDVNRPSLTGRPIREDLEITLKQRQKLFQQVADHHVDTFNKKPEAIVSRIRIIMNYNVHKIKHVR